MREGGPAHPGCTLNALGCLPSHGDDDRIGDLPKETRFTIAVPQESSRMLQFCLRRERGVVSEGRQVHGAETESRGAPVAHWARVPT
jgi:hypothetical protein